VYQPAKPREWTQQQLVGDLLDRAFAGSAKALVLGALSASKASAKELAEIQALLKDYEKDLKK
jgi:predicted transcriptional regulator